jgi:hypothetical protein
VQDKWEGKGKMTFRNGDKYEGYFMDWNMQGSGVYTFSKDNSDGYAEYVGEFKAGQMDGQGKLTYRNGNIFEGKFNDGAPVQ